MNKKVVIALFTIFIALVISLKFIDGAKEPKGFVPKYAMGWAIKDEYSDFKESDFKGEALELPPFWPMALVINEEYLYAVDLMEGIQTLKINPNGNLSSLYYLITIDKNQESHIAYTENQDLAVKGSYLYVAETAYDRIRILKINPDGSLTPKLTFGKEGKGLGEFSSAGGLAVKGDYLYIADSGSNRIHVLKISPDGNLVPEYTFGKFGKELGEFVSPSGLAIKEDYFYVVETANNRIHVLKINPDGSLTPKLTFGKQGKGLGEFSSLSGLAVKGNYLYVGDMGNKRIQVLEIKY